MGLRPGAPADPDSEAAVLQQDIDRRCVAVLQRAQAEKVIDSAADLEWVRRVYYALIGESLRGNADGSDPDGADPDALAARIIDTLLHGAGPRA